MEVYLGKAMQQPAQNKLLHIPCPLWYDTYGSKGQAAMVVVAPVVESALALGAKKDCLLQKNCIISSLR